MNKAYEIVNELTWTKKHRTMTVVVVGPNLTPEFLERSNRFVSSINRNDTIKSDVFLLADGNFFYLDPDNRTVKSMGYKDGGRSSDDIKKFATRCGYSQFCILESTDI
jgi:hypothetical protein